MVERYLEQQVAVLAVLTAPEVHRDIDLDTLSPSDVSNAEQLIVILQPLKTMTTILNLLDTTSSDLKEEAAHEKAPVAKRSTLDSLFSDVFVTQEDVLNYKAADSMEQSRQKIKDTSSSKPHLGKSRPIVAKFHYYTQREQVRTTATTKFDILKNAGLGIGVQQTKTVLTKRRQVSDVFNRKNQQENE
ncbi:hypothetical protein DPMN_165332 [Dreissena polymorpha]|uniref:Uncharacterized protein n=1 Tax=Dreissena polymorpha TaxID=45954 RepID=A0A9D4EVW5_DREPO|nr:hypothetical protein DPMN_165332 [Dreissena polymorpha]